MEFLILQVEYMGKRFEIEEDYSEVGAYLYVFEDDKCIKDFLQNDVEACKVIAYEQYGVPCNMWMNKNDK